MPQISSLHAAIVVVVALFSYAQALLAQLPNAAEIDAYLDRVVAQTKVPGLVALAVDADGVIYARAAGERSSARDVPMTMDTIFNIASMTKPIAATAVMMLVEEGKLTLDEPISEHIPEFADRQVISSFNAANGAYLTQPASREITVRQLLSHSSGLVYGFASSTLSRLTSLNPSVPAAELPLMFDPGTGWAYADGIGIVARVLERIEERPLDEFLRARLFEPLGMHDTGYVVPPESHSRVAAVYRLVEEGLVESPVADDVRSQVSGDGGLYSTAADYAQYIRMILNGGVAPDGTRLLSEESLRVLTTDHLGAVRVALQDEPSPALSRSFPLGAGVDGFGLGFQVTGEHRDPGRRRTRSLSWAGIFNTQFWVDPTSGIGAVLLMQYLPFYDDDAIATLVGFEQRLYEGQRARRAAAN